MLDLNVRPWVSISSCESLLGWTTEAGTPEIAALPDAAGRYAGLSRIRVTSGLNATSGMSFVANVASRGKIRFWVYVHQLRPDRDFINATLYASNQSNLNDRYTKYLRLVKGLNCITVSRERVSGANVVEVCWDGVTGSPNFDNNIQRVRIDVDGAGAGVAAIWYLCGVECDGYDRPVLIPTIDDSYASVASIAQPILDEFGIKATLYTITGSIGNGGYMTEGQLDDWAAAGHAVCNHTVSHLAATWNTSTDAGAITEEIMDAADWLDTRGFNRLNEHLHFSSPLGEHAQEQAATYRQVVRDNVLSAVTVIRSNAHHRYPDWHSLPRYMVNIVTDGETIHNRCINHMVGSGAVYIPLYHDFTAGAPSTALQVSAAQFRARCETYARLIHGNVIDNMTIPEWYAKVNAA